MENEKIKIQSFTDLNTWKKAHELVLMTYRLTKNFPVTEKYALIDQMRRAGISITSNIAEGFSRNSMKEKIQFYSIAQGSTTELQNQFILAKDLEYISLIDFNSSFTLSVIVHKLLNGLIKSSRAILHSS